MENGITQKAETVYYAAFSFTASRQEFLEHDKHPQKFQYILDECICVTLCTSFLVIVLTLLDSYVSFILHGDISNLLGVHFYQF